MSYFQTETTTAGTKTTDWSMIQNYTFSVDKRLTNTLGFFSNMSYTITDTKNGDRKENFFPLFVLTFRPPKLYNLSFGFNRTQTVPSEGASITNTNTNVAFNLPQTRWPSLSLSFNRSVTQDDLDPHQVDTIFTNVGVKTNYLFDILGAETEVRYSFSYDVREDKASGFKREDPTHFVGGRFSKAFWDDKIRASGDIGFSITENKTESLGAAQRFETAFPPDEGLSSVGVALLSTNNALIDGNLSTSAGIDLDSQSTNIVVRYVSDQAVFKIHLNVATSLTKAQVDTLDFGWELSTSSDGISFSTPEPLTPVYEEIPSKRLVFTFPSIAVVGNVRTAKFFRLVNTIAPPSGSFGLPVEVTEMEAVGFILSVPKDSFTSTRTSNFGGFRLTYSPSKVLSMSYNLSFSNSTEEITDSDNTVVTQGVNLRYVVIPKYHITVSSGFSTSSSTQSGAESTGSDAYTLTLSSRPLSTLNASLGFRRVESSTGGDTSARFDSLSADVSMKLYRGVALSLRGNLRDTKEFVSGSNTQTVSYLGNLRLQPYKFLAILFNGSTSRSEQEVQGVASTTTIDTLDTSFSLTPTRKLFFSGRFIILPEPNRSHTYTVSWLPTRKIQATARSSFSDDSDNYGADIFFNPLSRVSFNLGYSATRSKASDTEIDSIFARASVRF